MASYKALYKHIESDHINITRFLVPMATRQNLA